MVSGDCPPVKNVKDLPHQELFNSLLECWLPVATTCSFLIEEFYFWLFLTCCCLVEPFLCGLRPGFVVHTIQIVILFISAFLFCIQTIGEVATHWTQEIVTNIPEGRSIFVSCIMFIFKGRNIVEIICFVCGFVFIWARPGIAALRCFRVFRLLWLYESEAFKDGAIRHAGPYLGEDMVRRIFALMHFAIHSLTAVGNEMFRFTDKTKGGLMLMMVFFYSAYVFGAALWIETGDHIPVCSTLGGCTFTMMRLTFYDGTGFDYAYALTTHGHSFLFILVMVYLCVTAFGILNGLIGLFSNALSQASFQPYSQEVVVETTTEDCDDCDHDDHKGDHDNDHDDHRHLGHHQGHHHHQHGGSFYTHGGLTRVPEGSEDEDDDNDGHHHAADIEAATNSHHPHDRTTNGGSPRDKAQNKNRLSTGSTASKASAANNTQQPAPAETAGARFLQLSRGRSTKSVESNTSARSQIINLNMFGQVVEQPPPKPPKPSNCNKAGTASSHHPHHHHLHKKDSNNSSTSNNNNENNKNMVDMSVVTALLEQQHKAMSDQLAAVLAMQASMQVEMQLLRAQQQLQLSPARPSKSAKGFFSSSSTSNSNSARNNKSQQHAPVSTKGQVTTAENTTGEGKAEGEDYDNDEGGGVERGENEEEGEVGLDLIKLASVDLFRDTAQSIIDQRQHLSHSVDSTEVHAAGDDAKKKKKKSNDDVDVLSGVSID